MAESYDKKARIAEIGRLIGDAIIVAVDRPDSGQDTLTEEDKAKVKEMVAKTFSTLMEHHEWKTKTDPLIEQFKEAYLPTAIRAKLDEREVLTEAIREAFPGLDNLELESHAVLNLIATLTSVGPFRKIKDETLARIVNETYALSGLVIAYLTWRQKTTTPPKGDQH